MLSRLFGSKKNKQETDKAPGEAHSRNWSFLGTDMHSHMIPGIDDGAQTIEDSISLIEKCRDMGFSSLITTPHIKSDHYPNTAVIIQQGLHLLKQALAEKGIVMPVKAAAEYYIDDHFMELLERKELLTIKGNEVLVEISFLLEPMRFHEILFKIQMAGYRPILAHPERYAFYHDKPDIYRDLKNKGCLLQLNTISLAGYYGKPVKQAAEKILKNGLYDYCGSDMHHIRHAETLHGILSTNMLDILEKYPFLNATLHSEVI